jgi:hypothetical protein
MARRGQETKYQDPEAQYADLTNLIRDAEIHTIEAVEDRHTKLLAARTHRNTYAHIQWELAAGGAPRLAWLLKMDLGKTPEYRRWDPTEDWEPTNPERFRYRDPEWELRAAEGKERAAQECVPQIINCANTVRVYRNQRTRLGLNGDPIPPAPFEAIIWPFIIWRAIRTIRRLERKP